MMVMDDDSGCNVGMVDRVKMDLWCRLVMRWGMTRVVVLSVKDDVVSWMMMVWFDGVMEMAWCGGGSCKLKTHWSGPFTITKVFPYGTVKPSQANGPNFKVNGHRVKHYFGGDVPQLGDRVAVQPETSKSFRHVSAGDEVGVTRVVVLRGEDDVVSWMMMVWFDGVVEMAWCGGGSC
nr:reverse transcriptase domain-containing protein [Tanacetum cinerariifolium]